MVPYNFKNSSDQVDKTIQNAKYLAQDLVSSFIQDNNLKYTDILDSLAMLGLTLIEDKTLLSSESYLKAIGTIK